SGESARCGGSEARGDSEGVGWNIGGGDCLRPYGADCCACGYPRLAPWAIVLRPCGAGWAVPTLHAEHVLGGLVGRGAPWERGGGVMKRFFELALGIVTSMGGFLEVGSMATAAQAGAGFGYQLLWPILLGTICLIFLVEMAGRMAAVSHHPLPAAVRERFGFKYFLIPLTAQTIVDYLVLTSEVGGMSLGLQLLSGISFQWWAAPSAIVVWVLLWKGNFSVIEYGVSLLGLITVVFVVAAIKAGPEWAAAGRGLAPALPRHDKAHYWFLAVSILGATISPYLFNFYSSGAIEDDWDEKYLGI